MCGTTMIVDAPSIIMSAVEIIDSLTDLMMWRTEMTQPESSTIKDDAEIFVNETESTAQPWILR